MKYLYEIGQQVYRGWDQYGEIESPYPIGHIVSRGSLFGEPAYKMNSGEIHLEQDLLSKDDVDDIG